MDKIFSNSFMIAWEFKKKRKDLKLDTLFQGVVLWWKNYLLLLTGHSPVYRNSYNNVRIKNIAFKIIVLKFPSTIFSPRN